jgi:hypothetical protein
MRGALAAITFAMSMVVATASSAYADDVEARRGALFREGMSLVDQKRWSEAAKRFREVIALRSAPKALLALAHVERELGHFVSAKRLCERALADAAAGGFADDERDASDSLAWLAPRLPRVTLILSGGASVERVAIDGEAREPSAQSFDVDPGEHEIVVDARAGGGSFHAHILARESDKLEVRVAFEPTPPAPTNNTDQTPPAYAPAWLSRHTGAVIAGSAALVLGLGAGAYGLKTKSDYASVASRCGGHCTDDDIAPLDRDALVTNVLLGVAGAAAITAAIFYFALEPDGKPAAGSARLRVGPGGIAIDGKF